MRSTLPSLLKCFGFLLLFQAGIASADPLDPPLIIRQGDANMNGTVDLIDTEILQMSLISPTPICLLPNVNVSKDTRFDLRDLLLHSQYTAGHRTATEVSGPYDPPPCPGTLAINSGNNQTFVETGAPIPVSSFFDIFTEVSVDNLPCVDRTLLKTEFSIVQDTTGGALLDYNSTQATTQPLVGTQPDGRNEPIGLLTGPQAGHIQVRSTLRWSRADGSAVNSIWVDFWFWVIGDCGDEYR